MKLDSTVVVCAHNEESHIEACLESIRHQTISPRLIVVVLDKCTDRTDILARTVLENSDSVVIEKDAQRWKNSISENLELARRKAVGAAFIVVDADIVVPVDFLERLLPQLDTLASVSALARTDPGQGFLNRIVSFWERSYKFAPVGLEPRGGARAILREALDEIGGFRDVIAWDTDVDNRLRKASYKVKLDTSLTVLHRRRMTFRRSFAYQVQAGRARKELGIPLGRTVLHSILRLRPFVFYGYLKSPLGQCQRPTT